MRTYLTLIMASLLTLATLAACSYEEERRIVRYEEAAQPDLYPTETGTQSTEDVPALPESLDTVPECAYCCYTIEEVTVAIRSCRNAKAKYRTDCMLKVLIKNHPGPGGLDEA